MAVLPAVQLSAEAVASEAGTSAELVSEVVVSEVVASEVVASEAGITVVAGAGKHRLAERGIEYEQWHRPGWQIAP